MSTTNNFFEGLKLAEPVAKQEIFFRLYYNEETGQPIEYSMEERDEAYIEITAEEFAIADPMVYVKNGEIRKRKLMNYGKLVPSDNGYAVHAKDISLVDPTSDTYLEFRTYEQED